VGLLLALILAASASASAQGTGASGSIPPGTRFYVPEPNPGALDQVDDLRTAGKDGLARKINRMVHVPNAVWFTQGTPAVVNAYAEEVMDGAADANRVPVIVVYNVPGRDCAHYSDGGAATGNAYRAWIDAVVDAVGNAPVVVIVEPDGLPLLPSDCGQADPYDRVGLIGYAAHAFQANSNARIYIDAGNANWNTVGVMAERLVDAGVLDIDGFSLNVSNFQYTPNSNQYGTWISKCIAYATDVSPFNYDNCPDQYGSFGGVPLSSYGKWSNSATKASLNTSAENNRYAQLLGSAQPTVHFVVDTSRNGTGPWRGTNSHPASESDTEAWCNPPNRGAGRRPTADTGLALVDAYLWIKLPGESDGECFRWTNGPKDPQRGIKDPSAGAWFRQQAIELATLANPSF
jgi:endoglucanase